MGISRSRIRALRVFGAVFCMSLGGSTMTLASPAARPAPEHAAAAAPAAAPAPAPVATTHARREAVARPKPAPEAKPKPAPRKLRRARGSDITPAVAKMARKIINANYTKPFGTEIPFEIGGQHYVGRIERHYHPPGGKLHPWGYHHGCSVFVVVE